MKRLEKASAKEAKFVVFFHAVADLSFIIIVQYANKKLYGRTILHLCNAEIVF